MLLNEAHVHEALHALVKSLINFGESTKCTFPHVLCGDEMYSLALAADLHRYNRIQLIHSPHLQSDIYIILAIHPTTGNLHAQACRIGNEKSSEDK